MTFPIFRFAIVAALACSCSSMSPKAPPPAEPAAARPESEPPAPTPEPEPTKPEPVAPQPTPEPDPETKANAQTHYETGKALFREGRYDEAELELKEALNLYPFMAAANLVLGKVFLIRGAAARDQVMIDSARLMFKMALSIDPDLREADVLLSLFSESAGAPGLLPVKETSATPQ